MNSFKSECVYDAETKQWIEQYWVNDNQVDSDTYFSIIDREKFVEDKKFEESKQEDEMDEECFEYKDCECENGIDLENVIDIYTEMIQETNGCARKISEALWKFADIFVDCIDMDINENKCNECDGCKKCCGECDDDTEEIEELVCDNCENCDIPDEICRDIHIVEKIANGFEESDCQCEACLRNMIYATLLKGKNRMG